MDIKWIESSLLKIVEQKTEGILPVLFLEERLPEGSAKMHVLDIDFFLQEGNDRYKMMLELGKLMKSSPGITGIAMVTEAWSRKFERDEVSDKPVRDYDDKQEIVQISLLNANEKISKVIVYEIKRDENNIISLGERQEMDGESPLLEQFFIGYSSSEYFRTQIN